MGATIIYYTYICIRILFQFQNAFIFSWNKIRHEVTSVSQIQSLPELDKLVTIQLVRTDWGLRQYRAMSQNWFRILARCDQQSASKTLEFICRPLRFKYYPWNRVVQVQVQDWDIRRGIVSKSWWQPWSNEQEYLQSHRKILRMCTLLQKEPKFRFQSFTKNDSTRLHTVG